MAYRIVVRRPIVGGTVTNAFTLRKRRRPASRGPLAGAHRRAREVRLFGCYGHAEKTAKRD